MAIHAIAPVLGCVDVALLDCLCCTQRIDVMSSQLLSTSEGATLILTLSNPEHRNALGPEMYAAGVEALNVAEGSSEIRSIIITGEGELFSAGGNLQRLQNNRQLPPEHQAQSIEGLHNWIEAIRAFPKPVLAAVEGPAAGAAFSLALACDLIVAARNSVFVMAYSNIALSPDGGASWSLNRSLPRQLATELLMLGERIGAEKLHNLGVVNRICEPGQALGTALTLAEQLNKRAPNALTSVKELLYEADAASLNKQLASERDHFVKNLHHVNGGIGINAFLNKEKPTYE